MLFGFITHFFISLYLLSHLGFSLRIFVHAFSTSSITVDLPVPAGPVKHTPKRIFTISTSWKHFFNVNALASNSSSLITCFNSVSKNSSVGSSHSISGNKSLNSALNSLMSSLMNFGKFASRNAFNTIRSSSCFSLPNSDLVLRLRLPAIDNTVPNVRNVKS